VFYRFSSTHILIGLCLTSFSQLSFGQPAPVQQSTLYKSELVRVVAVIPIQVESASPQNDCSSNSPPGLVLEGATNTVCSTVTQTQKFRAIYESGGRQYSVILPNEPGESLELETPIPQAINAQSQSPQDDSTPLPNTIQATYTYPYVLFLGISYRPLPYLGGISRSHRGSLGMRGFGRGRR
jgi:hypothetical protein